MGPYILAFDLGTGGNKASIYDVEGNCLDSCFESYNTHYPRPGWHEQRPEDWWQAVVKSASRLIENASVDPDEIQCLAISGHSMAVVPLDKEGSLLREYIPIWSDTRAKEQTTRFFEEIDYIDWYQTTGNGFSRECYAVFKIMWYQDEETDMFARIDKVVGTKDYINYRLTGKIVTDNSYASGSGVYNLKQRVYQEEFITASGLSADIFPEIVPSHQVLGTILPGVAKNLGLSEDVLVMAGGVDNSCMALGAGVMAEGKVYLSLGSSAWIAVSSQEPLIDKGVKPFVFDHVIPGFYTSATSIFAAGSSFRWLKQEVCPDYAGRAEEIGRDVYDLLVEDAVSSPAGANGLIFNPSLGGAPAAYPGQDVKGAFLGLELRHNRQDLIRSVLEGITMDLCLMYHKLEELSPLGEEVIIVGGGSKNPDWRQLFADVFNRQFVQINTDQDAASLGAAAIAAVGAGLWPGYEKIEEIIRKLETARPDKKRAGFYQQLLPVYARVLEPLSEIGRIMEGQI